MKCRGNVRAKPLRSPWTLPREVDLNGDLNAESTLDPVRGPSGGLQTHVEAS